MASLLAAVAVALFLAVIMGLGVVAFAVRREDRPAPLVARCLCQPSQPLG